MKIVNAAVDLGNSMLKASAIIDGEKVRKCLPNKFQNNKTINPKARIYTLSDGTTIYFGVGNLNNNVLKHTRKHLLEQVLVMIHELYPMDQVLKVDLKLGLPPLQFFNDSYLKQFESLFPTGKAFDYAVNGISKKVTFNSVSTKVEGYSAFVSYVDEIGDTKQDILSIDVGGGTTDLCNYKYDYDDEMYYPDEVDTLPDGVIDFSDLIAEHFNAVNNADIKGDYIDSLLKNNKANIDYQGTTFKLEEYLVAIKPTTDDMLNKITNKFGSLDRYITIGAGGGFKTFRKMIKDSIKKEIEFSEEQQFYGNADGYLEQ